MKKTLSLLSITWLLFSCSNNEDVKGKFTLTGNIKNAATQNVYLEELYFSDKAPSIVDTGTISNGKFEVSAIAPEQGFYRIRLEKDEQAYYFINDAKQINVTLDSKDSTLKWPVFTSPANNLLREFSLKVDSYIVSLQGLRNKLQQNNTIKIADSIKKKDELKFEEEKVLYKNFILKYIDTTNSPIMALYILGFLQNEEPNNLQKLLSNLEKRFPSHTALNFKIKEFNDKIAKQNAKPKGGALAPEITMPDTEGKSFSLSSLKGKYVLVDFWASWCGPCRGENPNVVAAYNKFKDKNFTILGVSLDDNKEAWLEAIKTDNLTWKHISDLKKWNSPVVPTYGIEGIPYNVLLNPNGEIIASNLRGEMLQSKLAELIK
ncbi:MAG: AhpC/TSA family protein [Ferruginibacter sp.]|nr:AhpC/TSA family protein [Ferruginibacter sp.]